MANGVLPKGEKTLLQKSLTEGLDIEGTYLQLTGGNLNEVIDDLVYNSPSPEYFLGILNPIAVRDDRGKFNLGVYSFQLGDTQYALKISQAKVFDHQFWKAPYPAIHFSGELDNNGNLDKTATRFREYIAIHKILSDGGYAATIKGLLPHSEVLRLVNAPGYQLKRIAEQHGFAPHDILTTRTVGIIMEKIGDSWPISRDVPTTAFLASWSTQNLINVLQKLRSIKETLKESQIVPTDMQLLVTRDGGVKLIDLDAFRFVRGTRPIPISFAKELENLFHGYQDATGLKVPEAIKREFSDLL